MQPGWQRRNGGMGPATARAQWRRQWRHVTCHAAAVAALESRLVNEANGNGLASRAAADIQTARQTDSHTDGDSAMPLADEWRQMCARSRRNTARWLDSSAEEYRFGHQQYQSQNSNRKTTEMGFHLYYFAALHVRHAQFVCRDQQWQCRHLA